MSDRDAATSEVSHGCECALIALTRIDVHVDRHVSVNLSHQGAVLDDDSTWLCVEGQSTSNKDPWEQLIDGRELVHHRAEGLSCMCVLDNQLQTYQMRRSHANRHDAPFDHFEYLSPGLCLLVEFTR